MTDTIKIMENGHVIEGSPELLARYQAALGTRHVRPTKPKPAPKTEPKPLPPAPAPPVSATATATASAVYEQLLAMGLQPPTPDPSAKSTQMRYFLRSYPDLKKRLFLRALYEKKGRAKADAVLAHICTQAKWIRWAKKPKNKKKQPGRTVGNSLNRGIEADVKHYEPKVKLFGLNDIIIRKNDTYILTKEAMRLIGEEIPKITWMVPETPVAVNEPNEFGCEPGRTRSPRRHELLMTS